MDSLANWHPKVLDELTYNVAVHSLVSYSSRVLILVTRSF
jgi:hypothetical protein